MNKSYRYKRPQQPKSKGIAYAGAAVTEAANSSPTDVGPEVEGVG